MYWSESGEKIVLALEENYYLLDFNEESVANYVSERDGVETKQDDEEDDDGCEEAFTF